MMVMREGEKNRTVACTKMNTNRLGDCIRLYVDLNPLSPNVADLQHFDIEFFVASLFATLFSQELTLLQLV